MNITELSRAVADTTKMDGAGAKSATHAIFEQLAAAMARGEVISIAGFGKFSVKDTAAREGRNPRTGEAMSIAASKRASFSAAKGLKDKL